MNPGTKAKTIWMILLAVVLVAVPGSMVYAEVAGDLPEGEAYPQMPPPPGPPCRTYLRTYIAQHLGEDWDALGRRLEGEPEAIPEWAMPARVPACVPGYCPYCVAEREAPEPLGPWPMPPMGPPGPPPAEPPTTVPGEGHDRAEVKAQAPDGDVGIAAISSGVQPPYRSGLNAHGRAWTRAAHEPGHITWVEVDVWLWWWDGAKWIVVGYGYDSETQPCWRGLITARDLARWLNASTGWYAAESLHRVSVDGVQVYRRWRLSDNVWLTFP
ncbi:hypothetical protein M1O12_03555 [Dehalococcoidia bacterium]|nr:hypothetical protein [Dehalococcoidia bacterium]